MSLFGKIFGSEKAQENVIGRLDNLHFSKQEKSELQYKMIERYEPFKLSQRFIALVLVIPYALSYILFVSLALFGADNGLLNKSIQLANDMLHVPVSLIVAFYFAGGVGILKSKINNLKS